MSTDIIVSLAAEKRKADVPGEDAPLTPTLHELYPEEFAFFKRAFVWSSQTKGFYTRRRYDPEFDDLGRKLPKWLPFKSKGRWQHLYPQLVNSLVEKHLDFERLCRACDLRDRLAPRTEETAFWLGMMAGTRTYADCIDLDSHDIIGWSPVPTRWHESKTGWFDGPHSYRYLPVVRPSLRFFQLAKIIYDTSPGRIWSFSSANLGLAVWKIHRSPTFTHNVYPAIDYYLQAAGLNGIEHYPRPARSPASLGKCHRRPCGMDSGIITCHGVITDPIEQIRAFMRPPQTPPFETILAVYREHLDLMYARFLSDGCSPQRTRLKREEKETLVESSRMVMESVKEWSRGGYVLDWDLIRNGEAHPDDEADDDDVLAPSSKRQDPLPEPLPVASSESELLEATEHPDCFHRADLMAVAGSSQWVQYVKFLVENGIPVEDKFCEVVSTLALWFGFVELFGEDRQRIKDVIRKYVATRHNGKVTRLIAGQNQETFDHVDRIVDNVLDGEGTEGKELFAELRQKRTSGQYKQVYYFEPEIMGQAAAPLLLTPQQLPLHLLCDDLIQQADGAGQQPEWHYEPDLTPLPDEIISRIKAAFGQAKRQLRRDKSGRYPTLDAITRLFNYLYSGRTIGSRRASQKLMVQMGFVNNSAKRTPIFRLLTGLLHKGGYLSTTASRLWTLDKTVVEAMRTQRVEQRQDAS